MNANALILNHLVWANRIATNKATKLHNCDIEEAVAEAMVQFVRAARRWRSDVGTFATFAKPRIEGAILDLHRKNDPVGRHQRDADKAGKKTRHSGRGNPIRIPIDVFDLEASGRLAVATQATQIERVEMAEIAAAIGKLPDRKQRIMKRHFFDGESLLEIGNTLGITESRVCQVVAESVRSIKCMLAPAPA